jgi:hypothetical protein
MPDDKNRHSYARYPIIRGSESFFNGDFSTNGTKCRQIMISSNEFASIHGTFQVYCVEGVSHGIVDGELSVPLPYSLLFDVDFNDFDAAKTKFTELIEETKKQGFRGFTLMDELNFQSNLNAARARNQ